MEPLTDEQKQEKLEGLLTQLEATGIVLILDGGPMRGLSIRMDGALARTLPRYLRRLADTLEEDLQKKDHYEADERN